jgi:hypothetical protein
MTAAIAIDLDGRHEPGKADFIDQSFDHLFATRSSLPWWPWVGRDYLSSPTRTMLVGESVYEWRSPAGEFAARYAASTGLRVTHENHAMRFGRDSNYVRNIERAIFARRTPKDEHKLRLWTSVVYHNLILDAMASRHHRPTEAQYEAGWRELLALCEVMRVGQCLVYGLEAIKLRALEATAAEAGLDCRIKKVHTKIGRSRARLATVRLPAGELNLLFVRHPSAFFAWRAWSPVIRENLSVGFLEAPALPQTLALDAAA